MLLRYKIPLLGTITLSTLVLLLYAALHFMLTQSFRELEHDDVQHRVQQVHDAITNVTARLSSIAADYAAWDDTYDFMQTRDPKYPLQNQTTEGLVELRIDLMALFGTDGHMAVAKAVDLRQESDRRITDNEREGLERVAVMLPHDSPKRRLEGLLLTDRGAVLVGGRPIVQTSFEGPILGTLIVGKYLDDAEIKRISRVTHVSANLHRWSATDLPASAHAARERLRNSRTTTVVVPESDDLIRGYTPIVDTFGNVALLLEVSTDRSVYRQGVRTLRYVAASLFISGMGLNLVLLFVLNSQILRRLTRLSREVGKIRLSGDTVIRTTPQIADELGAVAAEINRLLDDLRVSGDALRESEQIFRLTFESAHEAILWIDPESGTILRSNTRAAVLAERSTKEMLGQPLTVLGDEKTLMEVLERIRLTSIEGEGFEMETTIRTPSGATHTCEISGVLTLVEGKRIVQTVLRDITEQRAMEQQRMELEERLHQSQKVEAIGQLAGGVAHDFNNLLAGISGYADLIRSRYGNLDPKLERYAGIIFETAQRAAELTNKLLTFARKGKKEFAAVDMHAAVLDVLRLLAHTVDRRIALVDQLNAPTATVLGDRSQLQNLIMNLALNARDAMPNGGELRFMTEVVDMPEANSASELLSLSPGRYLHLAVSDTGIGMDEIVKARLFEPFFTTKAPGKGTGLGLPSAYGTARDHDGQITVESSPGRGSTFHVYLPLARESATVPGVSANLRPESNPGAILLVDDEPLVREVTREMLQELGFTVHTAVDGIEAIAWYREHWREVDVVILDMIMPHMGGFECFQELSKINAAVRVIVASGYSESDEANRILNAGAAGFLQKPFNLMKLAKSLAKEQRRAQAQSTS